eukprot:scaffold77552_cov63-Phaeocystis_antarctica.AAC.2
MQEGVIYASRDVNAPVERSDSNEKVHVTNVCAASAPPSGPAREARDAHASCVLPWRTRTRVSEFRHTETHGYARGASASPVLPPKVAGAFPRPRSCSKPSAVPASLAQARHQTQSRLSCHQAVQRARARARARARPQPPSPARHRSRQSRQSRHQAAAGAPLP